MSASHTNKFKNTKILCTLGPSTDTADKITHLINAGIDGVRLNFSHGSHEYFKNVFSNIESACVAASHPIAVLADLQGPKIRIGELEQEEIILHEGDKIEIVTDDIKGSKERISSSYKEIVKDAVIGNNILIDDGLIKLAVTGKKNEALICEVIDGGILKPHKGLNLPGMKLNIPSLTEKDFSDIDFMLNYRVDFIALSFVRRPEDIHRLRSYLKDKGSYKSIIAKIEKQEAVDNFSEIHNAADGIMIARGDLGVELPPEEVPVIQKQLITECNKKGKMVITATQMLESMINHPIPTRAETSDVANAVWDGTDVVMLSGETSVGKYPLETVKMMNKILIETEEHMDYMKRYRFEIPAALEENLFESVGKALSSMAKQLNAGAIATITRKGRMASTISKFRPGMQIIALSDNFEIMNKLSLVWGVNPIFFDDIKSEEDAIRQGLQVIRERKLVNEDDTILFTSGAPDDEKGSDIWIRFVKA